MTDDLNQVSIYDNRPGVPALPLRRYSDRGASAAAYEWACQPRDYWTAEQQAAYSAAYKAQKENQS